VVRIWAGSHWIVRPHVVTGNLLREARIKRQIPPVNDVAPLHADAVVQAVSRCSQVVTRGAQEEACGVAFPEAVAVIDRAHRSQHPTFNVIELQPDADVAGAAPDSAGARADVRPAAPGAGPARRVR